MEVEALSQVKPVRPEEVKKLIEKLAENPDLIFLVKKLYIIREGSVWTTGQYILVRHNELLGFKAVVDRDKDVAELRLMYPSAVVEVRCVRDDCFINVESLISCTCGEAV